MSATPSTAPATTRRDRSHYLYLAVIVAVLGVADICASVGRSGPGWPPVEDAARL